MHKKGPKGNVSASNCKEKIYHLPRVKNLHFDDNILPVSRFTKSSKRRNKLSPVSPATIINDDETFSWDRQASINSPECSKDIEQVSTEKLVEQWQVVEDALYGKNPAHASQALLEECEQWRNQLPHLRIVGKSCFEKDEREEEEEEEVASDEEEQYFHKTETKFEKRGSHDFSLIIEPTKLTVQNRRQIREYVLDNLLEHVITELLSYQQEMDDKLNNDLEDYFKLDFFDETTDNTDNKERFLPETIFNVLTENEKKNGHQMQNEETVNGEAEEKDEDHPDSSRPKPGMVFGEKIIVSPVPCPVSTRESFTTMKINPMQLIGRPVEFSTSQGYFSGNSFYYLSRPTSKNAPSKPQSGWRRTEHSSPIPHNLKLSPMNLPTLPNHKKRSPKSTASSHRRILNPLNISKPTTTESEITPEEEIKNDDNVMNLDVQGVRITAKSKALKKKLKE